MNKIEDKVTNTAWNFLTSFLNFFYPKILKGIKQLYNDSKKISWRNIIIDITDVASSLGMFLILNIIAIFIFIWIPAGQDVLLMMVDEIVQNHSYGQLLWLSLGVVAWSVISEFAARYAIYVSDNSALTLDDQRVRFRKSLQKAFAGIFLLLPYLLVLAGMLRNYIRSNADERQANLVGYLLIAGIIYILLNRITHFYFDEDLRNRMRTRSERSWFNRLVVLPEKEIKWVEKLYGIYNTHIYTFPKPSNLVGTSAGTDDYTTDDPEADASPDTPRGKLQKFVRSVIDTGDMTELLFFPQDEKKLVPEKKIPRQFRLIGFSKEPDKKEGNYFWRYQVPLGFYRVLHRQVRVISTICTVLFLAISFLGISVYEQLGAPALIFISFGCICGMYVGIIYLDYTNRFFKLIPIRLLLFIIFIVSSFMNDDHPVRMFDSGTPRNILYKRAGQPDTLVVQNVEVFSDRLTLKDHFNKWAADYISDTTHAYYDNTDSSHKKIYPALFICAEGGALRTGAFSSYTLSLMQSALDTAKQNRVSLNSNIYALSGVSGGSLGLGSYYAYNYLTTADEKKTGMNMEKADSTFFSSDFLSPLIGKMFYGEFLQLFIPWHIEYFDRAIALEKSWEAGYSKLITGNANNIFSTRFTRLLRSSKKGPALFINTSEVETGLQCWLTNVDPTGLLFSKERDLFYTKIQGDIRFSTLINFSSRFPGFSPAGMLRKDEAHKFHYVDGGYVENTGAATMQEILQYLKPQLDSYNIRPFVIVFRYSPAGEVNTKLNWFNEVSEILYGIYNTRDGRTKTAIKQLTDYTEKDLKGSICIVPLDVQTRNSPQNWALSKRNLKNIMEYSKQLWDKRQTNELKGLYFVDTLKYKRAFPHR